MCEMTHKDRIDWAERLRVGLGGSLRIGQGVMWGGGIKRIGGLRGGGGGKEEGGN